MKPTHRLKVLNKKTNQRGHIGAGWRNPDGSITIELNPSCVMTDDKEKYLYTLFPETPYEKEKDRTDLHQDRRQD
jgi:hypothetical protein